MWLARMSIVGIAAGGLVLLSLAPRAAARCWPGYPACQLGSVPAVKT
jgi:hypothetical protein